MTDISRRIIYYTINGWCATAPGCSIVEGSTSFDGKVLTGEISTNYLVDTSIGWDNTGAIVRLVKNIAPKAELGLWILTNITVGVTTTFTLTHHYGSLEVPFGLGEFFFKLEDPYKISTTIPDWVTGSTARRRWAPVLTTSSVSLGQKINVKGGIASVDGLTLSGIYDADEQGFVDNGKFWPLLAKLFAREATPLTSNTSDEYVNLIVRGMLSEDFALNPLRERTIGIYYPIPTDLDQAFTEQQPIFIDSEAVVPYFAGPGTPFFDIVGYRSYNGTDNANHGKSSIIYDGLPFAIGSTCKVWTLLDSNEYEAELTYSGLTEAITLGAGLTTFSIQISSTLYTPNVALQKTRGNDIPVRTVDIFEDPENRGDWSFIRLYEPERGIQFLQLPDEPEAEAVLGGGRPVGDEDEVSRRAAAGTKTAVFPSSFYSYQQINTSYDWIKIGPFVAKIYGIDTDDEVSPSPSFAQGLSGGINYEGNSLFRYYLPIDNYQGYDSENRYIDFGWIAPNRTIDTEFPLFNSPRLGISPFFPRIIEQRADGFFPIDPPIPQDAEPEWYLIQDLPDPAKYEDIYNAMTSSRSMVGFIPRDDRNKLAQDIAAILRDSEIQFAHLFKPSGFLLPEISDAFEGPQAWLRNQFVAIHPADLLLQVLTSTGRYRFDATGNNGPFDTANSPFGLGIDFNLIDLESFEKFAQRNPSLRLYNATMVAVPDLDPSKFITDTVLKPFFLCLAQKSDGKITLIDLNDTTYSPETTLFSNDIFARNYSDGLTSVTGSAKITSEDLVDSVSYKFTTFFTTSFTTPVRKRSIVVQGLLANINSAYGIQTAQTRVFNKVQTSPIVLDIKNASLSCLLNTIGLDSLPPNIAAPEDALISRANSYLRNYRKIIARFTFTGLYDRNNPLDIGENFILQFGDFPSANGQLFGEDSICKIIDSKIDRERDLVQYTAIVFDRSSKSREIVWNLTARVIFVVGNDVTVSIDDFTQYGTGGLNGDFVNDYDQFTQSDVIRIFTQNFGDKALTPTIVSKIDNVWELDDATGIVPGDLIMLNSKATSTSPYFEFMVWFDDPATPLT
jgi:hypothetical protein